MKNRVMKIEKARRGLDPFGEGGSGGNPKTVAVRFRSPQPLQCKGWALALLAVLPGFLWEGRESESGKRMLNPAKTGQASCGRGFGGKI